MKGIRILAAAALLLAAGLPAPAERPFKTDDPDVVGLYRYEWNTGVQVLSGSWDGVKNRNDLAISGGFDYGLTERSEIGIQADIFKSVQPGKSGLGDVIFHYKHTLREPAEWEPLVSVDLGFKAPTASKKRGLGTGAGDYIVAGIAGWDRMPWKTAMRAAYVRPFTQGGGSAHFELGISGRYRTTESMSFLGELFTDSDMNSQALDRFSAAGGVAWEWSPTMTVDFMAIIGLADVLPDVGITVGMRSRI